MEIVWAGNNLSMVLFGISILMVSISFLYYRHLPRVWLSVKPWRRSNNPAVSNEPNDAISSKSDVKGQSDDTKESETIILNDGQNVLKKDNENNSPKILIAASDNNAMPPPPIPRKKPSSSPNHVAPSNEMNKCLTNTLKIVIDDNDQENRDLPVFPDYSSKPVLRISKGIQESVQHVPAATKLRSQGISSTNLSIFTPRAATASSIVHSRKNIGLAPTLSQSVVSTKPNKKIILKPGHSPLDWARLSNSKLSLSGLPLGTPYLKVRPSLLRTQTGRNGKKAWTVLGGRVYNITPYLPFHPGGESQLLRCAGRDGTELFNKVHPWVNWEGMLSACLVGIAVEEVEVSTEGRMNEMD